MTFDPQEYDYTPRDYDSLEARLQSLFQSVFPEWIDTDTDNMGNLLRKGFSHVGNVNDYYLNRRARGAFIGTVDERKDMIAQGKRVSYEMAGATAATADLTVTISNGPLPGDVTFSAGDLAQTQDVVAPVIGEVQAQVVISAGSTTGTLQWRHSQGRTKTYTSTGKASQEVFLDDGPYLDDSAALSTLLGDWEEVDSLALSGSTDLHFEIQVDQNDRATVRFGDGVNGAIPEGTFDIGYEIGGGIAGNVELDTLTRLGQTYTDSLGNQAIVTVTNALAASGGGPRETVNAARQLMPLSQTAVRTSVVRTDFEIHALGVSGVARALMLSSDEDITVPETEGRLFIVPEGGGTASSSLLQQVDTAVTVTYPNLTAYDVLTSSADYLTINVYAVIWISSGYSASAVKASIQTALTNHFAPQDTDGSANTLVDFGYNYRDEDDNPAGEVALSDVMETVLGVTGLRKVGPGPDDFTLNGARADIVIANQQFPALGTVTLINGMTGDVI